MRRFRYALRRTLPPWSFEENLAELREFLPAAGIDELVVKVDTEEFSHGQPELAWIEDYLPNLKRLAEMLAQIGVTFSINPWITVGHLDRGRDAAGQLPGIVTQVDCDGNRSLTCACPLSPVWRENLRAVWRRYAALKPAVIWIEDDIRGFNHGAAGFGCFCPLHLERFSQLVGRPVSREEVTEAIFRPGEPHPWRRLYLKMHDAVIRETCRFIIDTVEEVSSDTRIGLMSSGPRNHCAEGRDWDKLAFEFRRGGKRMIHRPTLGCYEESSLRELYYSQDSLKISRAALGDSTELSEVENIPYTRYSKSVLVTGMEILMSAALGCDGAALNLFDHFGTPLAVEPAYSRMLAELKPRCDALAAVASARIYRGVRLFHCDGYAFATRLSKGDDYQSLLEPGTGMMKVLEAAGISTTYDAGMAAALSGQLPRTMDDDAIGELLRRGLFLDAEAAAVLIERGFGADIGVVHVAPLRHPEELPRAAAEEIHHPGFGGAPKRYVSAFIPVYGPNAPVGALTPAEGAEVVSSLVDCDGRRLFPLMSAFTNRLGGRVVVHGFAYQSSVGNCGFLSPARLAQLREVFNFLRGGKAEIAVFGDGVYPWIFRGDAADGTILTGFMNLSLDPWAGFQLECNNCRCRRGFRLDFDGRWREFSGIEVTADDSVRVNFQEGVSGGEAEFFLLRP